MKKIILLAFLGFNFVNTFAQGFEKYTPANLKSSHDGDGAKVKHIAAAKMIVLESNGDKDSFYFDATGKLKGVSGKGYSYEIPAGKVILKKDGAVVSSDAPKTDFINTIKTKLTKALKLLKK